MCCPSERIQGVKHMIALNVSKVTAMTEDEAREYCEYIESVI